MSSQPVPVSFYHDTARSSYRIISLDGSKVCGKPLLVHVIGPFHGAIAVPSVTRCRCRRRRRRCGHRCAGGVRQYSGDTW